MEIDYTTFLFLWYGGQISMAVLTGGSYALYRSKKVVSKLLSQKDKEILYLSETVIRENT